MPALTASPIETMRAPAPTEAAAAAWKVEVATIGVILVAALGLRLWMISAFPTIPVSDFRSLVSFGESIRDTVWSRGTWHWDLLGAGLPSILAIFFSAFRFAETDAVARTATAVVAGLLPAVPFFMWRGAVSFRVRVLAAGLLAMWPGQILLSGVVAQDTWVMLPSVALGALAVRAWSLQRGYPIRSAALFALAVWFRQEMLVALLPLAAFAAVVPISPRPRVPRYAGERGSGRRVSIFVAASALFLGAIAGQRAMGTGRFALTTRHGGASVLGAYMPGAGVNLWTDPVDTIVRHDPAAEHDMDARNRTAMKLLREEFTRRPGFQLARMAWSWGYTWTRADAGSLYWSLGAPEVLPARLHASAKRIQKRTKWPVILFLLTVHALFVAVVIAAVRARSWAVLALASAVVLKGAMHAVLVSQPRYLLVAVALEMLAIGVGFELLASEANRKRLIATVVASFMLVGAIDAGVQAGYRRIAAADARAAAQSRGG